MAGSASPHRMNRDEFFAKLAPLDDTQLRKALWNLYWRGSAPLRERIEAELVPAEEKLRQRKKAADEDPQTVLDEVTSFVALARDGAYMYGDRRVSRQQRSKWRVTFRELAVKAQSALHAVDTQPGEQAMELIIGLARDSRDYEFFHSDDPMEAARFVVSDAASALWQTVLARHGSAEFARRAAPQLIAWESLYGWTRGGYGKVAERETALASVLAGLLSTPAQWAEFAAAYLAALDTCELAPASRSSYDYAYDLRSRAGELAGWHDLLLDRLSGSEADELLDRLVAHPALAGPDVTFMRAVLADRRGDRAAARKLVEECLAELPGSAPFIQYALQIGAELPPRSRELAEQYRYLVENPADD